MRRTFRTVLRNPILRVFAAAGLLVGLVAIPEWSGPDAPAPQAGRAYAQHSHPLLYDSQLGMYGHSDHVGTRYPFTEEALFQEVPSAAVAAGLKPLPQAAANPMVLAREVVHLEKEASDAQADAAVDAKGALWVAYCSFQEGGENIYVRSRGNDGTWAGAGYPLPEPLLTCL